MDIIVMISGAYRELMDKLDAIDKYVRAKRVRKPVVEDVWLDDDTVCAYLKVSRRTMQRYRSNGTLAYSIIGRKPYYRSSEITRALEGKRIRRKDEPTAEPSSEE